MEDLKQLKRLIQEKKEKLKTEQKKVASQQNLDELQKNLKTKTEDFKVLKQREKDVEGQFFSKEKQRKVLGEEKQEVQKQIDECEKQINAVRLVEQEICTLSTEISEHEKKYEEIMKTAYSAGEKAWRSITTDKKDSTFDDKIKAMYLKCFEKLKLSEILSKWKKPSGDEANKQPKFVNLMLIGGTGVGKSSFINTCTTALRNRGSMVHASVSQHESSETATIRFNLAPLRKENEQSLPIRLFDCRGICQGIGQAEMEMIINGHIKPNAEIRSAAEMENNEEIYRRNPGLADEIHCIVYVVRADRSIREARDDTDRAFEEIKSVRRIFTGKNVPQCVVLTAMDAIGVPNEKIGDIYKYPCAEKICVETSEDLQLPPNNVLPMSNYHKEATPTPEKDALALHNLWTILHQGIDHLQRNQNRADVPEGFYD